VYKVEFPDGTISEYSANVVAENMWAQCDLDGQERLLMQAIVDHRKDGNAVPYADCFMYRNGKPRLKTTTAGWFLCIQWKNGTTSWERLSDMKESTPMEVAEYAVSHAIDHEPAFTWWVPAMLKCRNRIIAAVIKWKHKPEEKFGIKVPNTLAEALQFDRENGDTQLHGAVRKEIDAVKVAFHVIDNDEVIPTGYQQIRCHQIYNFEDGELPSQSLVCGWWPYY
jgi:hypothetical protein